IKVREGPSPARVPEVQRAIASAQQRLDGSGRLLVRYSGTEMLARVMVEGEDSKAIRTIAQEIGMAIHRNLGVAPALLPKRRARGMQRAESADQTWRDA